jgi:hypothetical protein
MMLNKDLLRSPFSFQPLDILKCNGYPIWLRKKEKKKHLGRSALPSQLTNQTHAQSPLIVVAATN